MANLTTLTWIPAASADWLTPADWTGGSSPGVGGAALFAGGIAAYAVTVASTDAPLLVGTNGGSGTALWVNDQYVTLNDNGTITAGSANATTELDAGTINVNGHGSLTVADTYKQTGGILNVGTSGSVSIIGNAGVAATLVGGAINVNGGTIAAGANLNQSGGTINVNSGTLTVGNMSTLNQTGGAILIGAGTLAVGNLTQAGGSIAFNASGGVLQSGGIGGAPVTISMGSGLSDTVSLLSATHIGNVTLANFGTGDTLTVATGGAMTNGAIAFSGNAAAGTLTITGTIGGSSFTDVTHVTTPGTINPVSGNFILSGGSNYFAVSTSHTAPTITGLPASESGTDAATTNPFGTIVVTDPDTGSATSAVITLTNGGTVTDADGLLSGTGLTKTGVGTYSLAATTAVNLTTELDALSFTPTMHQVALGGTVATNFGLIVAEGTVTAAANTTLAVITQTVINSPPIGLPINVASFSGNSGFLLSGNATVTSGGILQLTTAVANQDGMALDPTAFPSATGISVQFTYYAGGGNGADGFSFFLLNADTAGAASNVVEGASGGGLGYADQNVRAGITSGFLGLGIDTHGNFSAPGNSVTNTLPNGTGRLPNSIAVRGAGTGTTGYSLLTNTAYAPGINGARTVRVNLLKVDSSHELLSVFMSNDGGTTFQEVITNYSVNQILPNNFYLGFAASTGAAFDTHQISNVLVTLPVALTVSVPTVNYPTPAEAISHTLLPGDAFSYSYTITDNGPNGSSQITVQDAPPSNVIGMHWTLQDDLHPAGSLETGTGAINLGNVNLSNGDVATVTVYGTIDPTATSGNADHAITVTPGSGFSYLTPSTGQVGLGIGSPAIFVIGNAASFPTTDTASVLPFGLIQITDSNASSLYSATIKVTGSGGTPTDADGLLSGTGLTKTTVGTYTLSAATPASLATLLNVLTFTPTNHQVAPGNAVTTGISLTIADGIVTPVVSSTTVVATAQDTAPAFSGIVTTQAVADNANLSLVSAITLSDPDFGASETVTIQLAGGDLNGVLSGTGVSKTGSGTYTLTAGTPASVTAALRSVIFTPTSHEVAPGNTVTTGVTLSVSDGIASAITTATTIVATAQNTMPMITGVSASASTTDATGLTPFPAVAVTDPDTGAATSASVVLTGGGIATDANGVLSGSGLTKTGTGTYTLAATSPASLTTELKGLVFTPTIHQFAPGGSTETAIGVTVAEGSATISATMTVTATAPPTIAMAGPIAGDNTVNANEAAAGFTISGTAAGLANGRNATITVVNSANTVVDSYTTAVTGNAWSVNVTPAQAIGLADGSYTVNANVSDASGNPAVPATQTLTVRETPLSAPGTPVLAPASDSGALGDNLTNVGRPTLTGSAPAGSTVNLYDGGTLIGAATAAVITGAWAITATTSITQGTNTLVARDIDSFGNVSAASGSLIVTLDTIAPAAPAALALAQASDSGALGDGITNINRPTITGTATQSGTIAIYDGTTLVGTGTVAPGAWSIPLTRSLLDGSHSVTATETDAAGNVSAASAALTVVIDTAAPPVPAAPTLAAGSDSGYSATDGITNVVTPTVTGSAPSGDLVTLYDTNGAAVLGTTTAVGGVWSIIPNAALSAGSHGLTVTNTDVAGNTSNASAPLPVTIDTMGPSAASIVSITASPGTGELGVGAIVTLTITLNEPVVVNPTGGLPSVTLNDGGTATMTGISADGTVITASYTVLSGQNTADLAVTGMNLNGATITDLAGNPANTAGVVINLASGVLQINTTAPSVPAAPTLAAGSDSGYSATDGITNVVKPTITGSAPSGDLVTLYDTNGAAILGTTTAVGGVWSIIPNAALSAGSHGLTVTNTDVAGNTSNASAPLPVIIDTMGPSAASIVSITASPGTGELGVGAIVTLTITLNEPVVVNPTGGLPSVTLNDGGTATMTGISADGTVITASYTVLSGQNTADLAVTGMNLNGATITDLAGNPANTAGVVINLASGVLQINTTAPPVPAAPTLAAGSDSGYSATDGITNVVKPTITGSAPSGDLVTLYDTNGAAILGTTTAVGGVWSIIPNAALSAGSHGLTVTNTDLAANTSNASAPLPVTINTMGPSAASIVSITASPGTGELGVGVTVTLTITLNEPVVVNPTGGLPSLTLNDGGTATMTGISADGTVITASYTVLSGQNTADLAVTGMNLNGATITDLAGNPANTAGVVINLASGVLQIDTMPPTITINAPFAGDNTLNAGEAAAGFALVGTTSGAEDGQIASVTIVNSANTVVDSYTTAITGNAWSINVTAAQATTLADGDYAIAANVSDATGNIAVQANQTLTVDETSPVIAIAPVTDDNLINISDATDGFAIAGTTGGTENGQIANVTIVDSTNTVVDSYTIAVADNVWSVEVTAAQATALADHSYTVRANVSDVAGNKAIQATQALTVDETVPAAPGAPVLSPASDSGVLGDDITNVALPTFTGSAPAGTTIDLYDGATLIGASMANVTTGAWSITTQTALNQGFNTIVARDISAAGNTSGASNSVIVTLDTTAPVVTGVSVSPGTADLDAGSVITLTLTLSGPVTVVTTGGTPTLILNDGGLAAYVSGSGTNTLAFSYTVLAGENTSGLAVTGSSLNGGTIEDSAGNEADLAAAVTNLAGTIKIDTTVPAIAIATPIAGDNIVNASEAATGFAISGTTGGLEDGQIATIALVDNANSVVDSYTTAVDGDAWSVNVIAGQATALSDGTYTVLANVSDAAGNPAAEASQTLTVHETPPNTPSTPVLAPASDSGLLGDDLTNVTRPILTGSAPAGDTVSLYDGSTLIGTGTADATTGVWVITPATGLAQGANTLVARDISLAGNTSAASAAQIVTIDTGAPTIAIATPIAGDNVVNANEAAAGFAISGTTAGVTDGQVATINLINGSGVVVDSYPTLVIGNAWSVNVTPAQATALANGGYTVVADVSDAAGNAGSVSAAITLATTPPVVRLSLIAVTTGSPVIGCGGAPNAVVTLSKTIAGVTTPLGTANAYGSGIWSVTPTLAAATSTTIVATETDTAGNMAAATAVLTYTASSMVVNGSSNLTINSPMTGNYTVGLGTGNGDKVILNGGSGTTSTVTGSGTNTTITAGNGNTLITGLTGGATITLGDGNDTVSSMSGPANSITVGNGNNHITTGNGSGDVVNAGNGGNSISATGSNATITVGNGATGIDTIAATGAHDTITAGNALTGTNVINATGTGDTIVTGSGNDSITVGGVGAAAISAGLGFNTITFAGSGNVITNQGGTDTLTDNGGSNILFLPAAVGHGLDTVTDGPTVLANGDIFNLVAALNATSWDRQVGDLGNYLILGTQNNAHDTSIAIDPSGRVGGPAYQLTVLDGAGSMGLTTFLNHAVT